MIDRLKAVISDKDAEIARLKAENEQLLRELKMQGEMREKETK
jgi:hypothetical protein